MNLHSLSLTFRETLSSIYDESEADSIFLIVLEHYLKMKRTDFMLNRKETVSGSDLESMMQVLERLKQGLPVQYITGESYFYGLTFKVNEAVLIPRPETEELVEWVIDTVKAQDLDMSTHQAKPGILDIGTGSGCIAISLKHNLPAFAVEGLDFSASSLAIASENSAINKVEVKWILEDILNPKYTCWPEYSMIVSNPPYITTDEKVEMHQNVLNHEPHHALFVSNEDPLIFYRVIAGFAKDRLRDCGWLFFEINETLGQEMIQLLKLLGFSAIELRQDFQGKDRMIRCRYYREQITSIN